MLRMRRLRWLLALVILSASVRWLPATWFGRESEQLWEDDLATQRRLAAGVDASRPQELPADRFMTGDDRFDGEWLFATSMMAALGYLQTAQVHPALRAEHLAAADACIEQLLSARVRAFDRAAWGHDPLGDIGSDRAHVAYLGYLNLVLSLRRVVEPSSPHAELNDRISRHLDRALRRRRDLLPTYPGETYPVDNTAAVASLALHAGVGDDEHLAALRVWDDAFEKLQDPRTGLLFQLVGAQGRARDVGRGSGTALASYFLSFSHPEQSASLYRAVKTHLHRDALGFAAVREYEAGSGGRGDIDSGPLVAGLSISATGFMLAASRAHRDPVMFASLWATTSLFGAPVDRDGRRNFALGGPLGDALMFALLTARPAGSWGAA